MNFETSVPLKKNQEELNLNLNFNKPNLEPFVTTLSNNYVQSSSNNHLQGSSNNNYGQSTSNNQLQGPSNNNYGQSNNISQVQATYNNNYGQSNNISQVQGTSNNISQVQGTYNNNNNSNNTSKEEQKMDPIKTKKKTSNTINLDAWLASEGPTLLQESLKKLKLDEKQIHKTSMEGMSLTELEEKKKQVKNELKRYDLAFEGVFNRPPIRNEKEPMRPLYIYYKLIKQSLTKLEAEGNSKPQQISNKEPLLKTNSNNNRAENFQKSKSFEFPSVPPVVQNVESNKIERPTKFSMSELKKRLEELKKSKNDLRNKLHNYQQSFTKDNNRKIKYHKDIAPVEEDYKRYKELKSEIAKIEEIVNSGSSRGSAGN